jgi:hypothetical protein
MEEGVKNKIILILFILCVIFFISTISSCVSAQRYKTGRDKEINARFDLEQKLEGLEKEKQVYEGRLSALTQELNQEKAAHELTKKELLQEQLASQGLKDEVVKVTRLKEKLEEDLKEALVATKSAKSKK